MSEIAPLIVGSEKLTSIFGGWPSFHDAEVHELHFHRGHVDTDNNLYEFPRLTVKVHLWLMTNDVDQKGYYVSTKHTLTTMKFYDVDEFKMEGFNHQTPFLDWDSSKRHETKDLPHTSRSISSHRSESALRLPTHASKSLT
jgi:Immunity protein 50